MTKAQDKGASLPATTGGAALPAEFADNLFSAAGAGMEGVSREDMLIARLGIIQQLSPQLNPRKPEYIEGAKVGMIFNTATNKLYPEGVHVVPVVYERRHIAWRRNRGGLAHDYGTDDSILSKCREEPKQDRPDVKLLITPDDNILTVTATWYILILDEQGMPAFIPMASSQWKPSRKWMTMATSERVNHPERGLFQPPLFYRTYRLGTALVSKGDDEWCQWTVTPAETVLEVPNSGGLLKEAALFLESIRAGKTTADVGAFGDERDGERQEGGGDTF